MAPQSDDIEFLTASDLCRLAGIKRPRRAKWADDDHVRKAPRGCRYAAADLVELVGFTELVRALDYEDAVLAWADVRAPLRERLDGEHALLVLFDERQRTGRLLSRRAEVGEAMWIGHPSVLLDLSAAVDQALQTCRRLRDVRRPRVDTDAEPVRALRAVRTDDLGG